MIYGEELGVEMGIGDGEEMGQGHGPSTARSS